MKFTTSLFICSAAAFGFVKAVPFEGKNDVDVVAQEVTGEQQLWSSKKDKDGDDDDDDEKKKQCETQMISIQFADNSTTRVPCQSGGVFNLTSTCLATASSGSPFSASRFARTKKQSTKKQQLWSAHKGRDKRGNHEDDDDDDNDHDDDDNHNHDHDRDDDDAEDCEDQTIGIQIGDNVYQIPCFSTDVADLSVPCLEILNNQGVVPSADPALSDPPSSSTETSSGDPTSTQQSTSSAPTSTSSSSAVTSTEETGSGDLTSTEETSSGDPTSTQETSSGDPTSTEETSSEPPTSTEEPSSTQPTTTPAP
ncbi:hypothetical protein VKS41_006950 [Umbelopsis sp. WA50703]